MNTSNNIITEIKSSTSNNSYSKKYDYLLDEENDKSVLSNNQDSFNKETDKFYNLHKDKINTEENNQQRPVSKIKNRLSSANQVNSNASSETFDKLINKINTHIAKNNISKNMFIQNESNLYIKYQEFKNLFNNIGIYFTNNDISELFEYNNSYLNEEYISINNFINKYLVFNETRNKDLKLIKENNNNVLDINNKFDNKNVNTYNIYTTKGTTVCNTSIQKNNINTKHVKNKRYSNYNTNIKFKILNKEIYDIINEANKYPIYNNNYNKKNNKKNNFNKSIKYNNKDIVEHKIKIEENLKYSSKNNIDKLANKHNKYESNYTNVNSNVSSKQESISDNSKFKNRPATAVVSNIIKKNALKKDNFNTKLPNLISKYSNTLLNKLNENYLTQSTIYDNIKTNENNIKLSNINKIKDFTKLTIEKIKNKFYEEEKEDYKIEQDYIKRKLDYINDCKRQIPKLNFCCDELGLDLFYDIDYDNEEFVAVFNNNKTEYKYTLDFKKFNIECRRIYKIFLNKIRHYISNSNDVSNKDINDIQSIFKSSFDKELLDSIKNNFTKGKRAKDISKLLSYNNEYNKKNNLNLNIGDLKNLNYNNFKNCINKDKLFNAGKNRVSMIPVMPNRGSTCNVLSAHVSKFMPDYKTKVYDTNIISQRKEFIKDTLKTALRLKVKLNNQFNSLNSEINLNEQEILNVLNKNIMDDMDIDT